MSRMKALRILVLLLIIGVVLVTGCKVGKEISDKAPGTLLGTEAVPQPSEQVVDNGLNDLKEIDTLEDSTDLGLDELQTMDLK